MQKRAFPFSCSQHLRNTSQQKNARVFRRKMCDDLCSRVRKNNVLLLPIAKIRNI